MSVQILVVEDTRFFATILHNEIEEKLGFDVTVASSLAEARRIIEEEQKRFFLALLDLNLPDAPTGEVVDYIRSKEIPAIVFTGELDDNVRDRILSKNVIDYVVKEGAASLDYVVAIVRRIHLNQKIKVLVVDDSRSARSHIAGLLRLHLFQVLEAEGGAQAMQILDQHPDIRLVVTDYNMPEMDGFALIKKIRLQRGKNELAIIGVSSYGNNILSAKFIKNGANDFINKPFLTEEFFCRVNQNVEIIEHIAALREASIRDPLTGLHNRRFFFDSARQAFASAKRGQLTVTVAMIDIDFFKKINDTYGHDGGDTVLRRMAGLLKEEFRDTDLVARFGGEEFCILCINLDQENTSRVFESLRVAIEAEKIHFGNETIRLTASIGVCSLLTDTLEQMLAVADGMLYEAKNGGRNQVRIFSNNE